PPPEITEELPTGELIVSCQDIDASYGQIQVLFGVHLEVQQGEMLALLGTNGAGKSTVLRVVAGLLRPQKGRVIFEGEDITDLDPVARVKRGLVTVPGGRGVFGSLTVAENLRLAGWLAKGDTAFIENARARVFELFPALERRLSAKASDLSGGEQQMLTLSQAQIKVPARAAPERVSPNGHARLVVSGISRRFAGVVAVDAVDLRVEEGQILGIIGSNGAGKTTLFDLCSGFLAADTGHVLLEGRDVTELGAPGRADRGIGRSFQDARLFPSMTVAETIATALERHVDVREPTACMFRVGAVVESEGRVADRVEELLETMGLQGYRDAFVSELSTGTRRIVEL